MAADLKKKRTFRTFSYRGVELEKLLDLGNEEVRSGKPCRKMRNSDLLWSHYVVR